MLVLACSDQPVVPDETAWIEREPLPIGLIGCEAIFEPALCMRSKITPLTLWLPGHGDTPLQDVELWWSTNVWFERVASERVRIDGDAHGLMIEVDGLPLAGTLELRLRAEGRFVVRLEPTPQHYLELRGLADVDRAEAGRQLQSIRATTDGRERFLIDCFEQRLVHDGGDRPEDRALQRDAPLLLAEASARVGDVRCLNRLLGAAAHLTIHTEPDFLLARRHIQTLASRSRLDPSAGIEVLYLEALLDYRLGRPEAAMQPLLTAAGLSSRTERFADVHADVLALQSLVLAELGRLDESLALLDTAQRELDEDRALEILVVLAWIELLRRDEDPEARDPAPALEHVIARLDDQHDERRANNARVNLAYAHTQNHDFKRAEQVLDAIEPARLDIANLIFVELTRSRLARPRSDPQARVHLERAEILSMSSHEPAMRLRVHLERAELEMGLGEHDVARREFEQAEQLADEIALGIGFQAGRSLFSSARSRSRALHVELLIEMEDPEAALCVLLGARARHLRSLVTEGEGALEGDLRARYEANLGEYHERKSKLDVRVLESWRASGTGLDRVDDDFEREREALASLLGETLGLLDRDPPAWHCEDVRPVDPTRALLTMSVDSQRLDLLFLLDHAGAVDVVRIPAGSRSPRESAVAALSELESAGHLAGVEQLTVVPAGALGEVDMQTLTWPDRNPDLIVVHGLGIGPGRVETTHAGAAVVLGSAANLREASHEHDDVIAELVRAGWQPTREWGASDTTQPVLMHYVGHARNEGLVGWESALELADGALSAGEVIAGQRAPRIVVLGACEAGMTHPEAIDGGMNMATAFLLAGAELVVAPDHRVDDRVAREFAERLYRAVPGPAEIDRLVPSLLRELAKAHDDEQFIGWRAWTR